MDFPMTWSVQRLALLQQIFQILLFAGNHCLAMIVRQKLVYVNRAD